jgi:hypothetical protein
MTLGPVLSYHYRAAHRSALPAIIPLVLLIPSSITGLVLSVPGPGGVILVGAHSTGTLAAGPSLGTHFDAPLYEVVLSDDQVGIRALDSLGAYLNSTPVSVIRFGGQGASYDPTTETNYLPPSTGSGAYVATSQQLWNLTWFKSWCDSRTPHCDWLVYLPGEENNTAAAVHYARWFHTILGLAPTDWEFGNEPSQWTHFGKNMSTWTTTDALQPTAIGYATMVHDYIAAVTAIYPHDKFIGLEAACACNTKLAAETAQIDGSLIAGMAYHSYPSSLTSSTVVSGLYALLSSSGNITSTSARFRGAVASGCPTCGDIPVGLGEYQAGPFSAFSPLAAAYPGAPFIAASVIEAIRANLSTFSVYDSDSLFNLSSGSATFQGVLYDSILANMTMGTDFGVTVQGSGLSGIQSLLVKNGTREALLVVNANSSTALSLSVPGSVFAVGGFGSEWSWGPSASSPTYRSFSALPSTYTIPAAGILLLGNY